MQAGSREIQSCLCDTSKGMKRAILEAVATGAVASGGDVKRFKECTLLQATVGDEVSKPTRTSSIQGLLRQQTHLGHDRQRYLDKVVSPHNAVGKTLGIYC